MTEQENENSFKALVNSLTSFKYFTNNIFSKSFLNFIYGSHVDKTCDFLQSNKKTMRLSSKDHFKSTSFYANIMWKMLQYPDRDIEVNYFSYNKSLASYHISKIKTLVKSNPYFKNILDLKSTAQSVIKYSWDGKHTFTVLSNGLLGFKRGIHCPFVYVDDPFQDPDNQLNQTKIKKINNIMSSQVMDIPFRDGELHVAGTAQTTFDFFFDKELTQRFSVRILPAIQDEQTKAVLWPEWMDFEELVARRKERGNKIFNREYMCEPYYLEESYLKRKDLQTNSHLENLKELKTENDVYLGWDIGGKVHPSHVFIAEKKESSFFQRLSLYMENMELTKQLEKVNELMDNFSVTRGLFDYTREELKTSIEQGKVHPKLIPIKFTEKSKFTMAADLDKEVSDKSIFFINDKRMINQMLVVDNQLNALETPEGHGDSFWSACMAVHAANKFRKRVLLLDGSVLDS